MYLLNFKFEIMGEREKFHESIRLVIKHVPDFNLDSRVSVFEVNIRVLGGLLSAHIIATDKTSPMYMHDYKDELLVLAKDLADRLIPAFYHSTTGIPWPRVCLFS